MVQWLGNGVTQKWFPRKDLDDCGASLRANVADGTTVQEPGSKGTSWRIHYSLELSSLRCNEIVISGKEKGKSFKNFTVQEGDLWMGDRIYAKAPGIDYVLSHGGDVLVHTGWNSLQLYDEQGHKFKLLDRLRRLKLYEIGDWSVFKRTIRGS